MLALHVLLLAVPAVGLPSAERGVRPAVLFCAPAVPWAGGGGNEWFDLAYLSALANATNQRGGLEIDYTENLSELNRSRLFSYNAIVLFRSPRLAEAAGSGYDPAWGALADEYVRRGGGVLLFPSETNVGQPGGKGMNGGKSQAHHTLMLISSRDVSVS